LPTTAGTAGPVRDDGGDGGSDHCPASVNSPVHGGDPRAAVHAVTASTGRPHHLTTNPLSPITRRSP